MQSLWPCKILRFMVYMSLGSALLPNQMISEEYFKYYYWLGEETWHLTQVKKQLLWLDMSKQKWQCWIMWYCCVTDGGTLYTIKELIRYTKKEKVTHSRRTVGSLTVQAWVREALTVMHWGNSMFWQGYIRWPFKPISILLFPWFLLLNRL